MNRRRLTTPNALTIGRIALIPVFVLFAMSLWTYAPFVALFIFCTAAITDKLDGYLARKYNQVTSFGKIMDPLADKLLVIAAFQVFLAQGRISVVPLLLIIARELAVSSLRVVAMSEGKLMPAAWSGKIKTAVQLTVAIVYLLWPERWLSCGTVVLTVLAWITAAVTLWSGFDYFWTNRALIHTSTDRT